MLAVDEHFVVTLNNENAGVMNMLIDQRFTCIEQRDQKRIPRCARQSIMELLIQRSLYLFILLHVDVCDLSLHNSDIRIGRMGCSKGCALLLQCAAQLMRMQDAAALHKHHDAQRFRHGVAQIA